MNNRRDRRLFDSLKHFWVPNYDGCTPAEGELPQLLPHPQHANSRGLSWDMQNAKKTTGM
jgi:hypothetical protein